MTSWGTDRDTTVDCSNQLPNFPYIQSISEESAAISMTRLHRSTKPLWPRRRFTRLDVFNHHLTPTWWTEPRSWGCLIPTIKQRMIWYDDIAPCWWTEPRGSWRPVCVPWIGKDAMIGANESCLWHLSRQHSRAGAVHSGWGSTGTT